MDSRKPRLSFSGRLLFAHRPAGRPSNRPRVARAPLGALGSSIIGPEWRESRAHCHYSARTYDCRGRPAHLSAGLAALQLAGALKWRRRPRPADMLDKSTGRPCLHGARLIIIIIIIIALLVMIIIITILPPIVRPY